MHQYFIEAILEIDRLGGTVSTFSSLYNNQIKTLEKV